MASISRKLYSCKYTSVNRQEEKWAQAIIQHTGHTDVKARNIAERLKARRLNFAAKSMAYFKR